MMKLPGRQQRVLNRLEQTLLAEDPGLCQRFAVFTRLTRDEPIPAAEQVRRRRLKFLRPRIVPPAMVISLVTLLAASSLMPGGPAQPSSRAAAVQTS